MAFQDCICAFISNFAEILQSKEIIKIQKSLLFLFAFFKIYCRKIKMMIKETVFNLLIQSWFN